MKSIIGNGRQNVKDSWIKAAIGAVAAVGMLVGFADPGISAPGGKRMFRAGSPGDPKKPFRVIEVKATEGNGTMAYDPPKVQVTLGEQVKFVIQNAGELDHEFMLDSLEANKKHAIAMLKNPEMVHEEPNGRRVVPKKADEILWRFDKVGTFEYACLIPGHYEAGMKGLVEVLPKGKAAAKSAVTK